MEILIVFLIIYSIGAAVIGRFIRIQQSLRRSHDQVEKMMRPKKRGQATPRNAKKQKINQLKQSLENVQELKSNQVGYLSSTDDIFSLDEDFFDDKFTNEYRSIFDDELEELEHYYSEIEDDGSGDYIDDAQGQILREEVEDAIQDGLASVGIEDFRQAIIFSEIISKPKSMR